MGTWRRQHEVGAKEEQGKEKSGGSDYSAQRRRGSRAPWRRSRGRGGIKERGMVSPDKRDVWNRGMTALRGDWFYILSPISGILE